MKNNRLMLSLITMMILLTQQASAGNDQQVSKCKAYKIPKDAIATSYMPNVVIVKLSAEYNGALQRNSLLIPELQKTFELIGVNGVSQQFPNASNIQSRLPNGKLAPDLRRVYRIQYEANVPLQDVIDELSKSKYFEYVEPSFVYQTSYTPNDPDTLSSRNYYQKIIKAYEAWDVSKGDTNVTIAIVDSGGDLDHPDLAGNVKYNHDDPIDGQDNDNDGYIDNYMGWDMVGNSLNPFAPDGNPNVAAGGSDHGVHVGGDAAARPDNGVGVAGVGFNCKLLFIKTTTDDYSNGIYTGYEGIVYAADQGAQIINCSWGGSGGGSAGQDVIDYAISKGSLVVAAAGNSAVETKFFPAAYDGVLTVGASTSADRRSSFSNFGYWLDVTTPGSSIYSTVYNDSWGSYDGTSMASPITAGAAALVKSHNPNFNPMQVAEQLRVTADDISAKNSSTYKDKLGKGRINVHRALTVLTPSVRIKSYTAIDNNNGSFIAGDTVTLNIDFINYLQATSNLSVTLSTPSTQATISNATHQIGALATMASASISGVKVFVKSSAPANAMVPVKIAFTDGAYTDFQYIELEVNLSSLNITVNQIASTATGVGRVGYRNGDATGGLGIQYKGFNMLFEASVMVGASSTQVSNNARSETAAPNEDFVNVERIRLQSIPGVDFFATALFNDAATPSAMNVAIKQQIFAWAAAPDDKYIIVKNRIKNDNANALNGIYPGMFFDLDISDYTANQVVYDTLRKMAVASTYNSAEPLLGIKILSNNVNVQYYGQANGEEPQANGFSIAEKFTTLSSGIVNPEKGTVSPGADIMFTIAAGPLNFSAFESKDFAYAIIAGDNVSDINASAAAAQAKYDNFVSTVGLNSEKQGLEALVYPNPSSEIVWVLLEEQYSLVKVEIFDLAGRLVLHNERIPQDNKVKLDVSKLSAGSYVLKMSAGNKNFSQKLEIK